MSLAIAVTIAGSALRSSARRARRRRSAAAREVGDDVHRVGRRTAVAEREQRPAAREDLAQRGGRGRERRAPSLHGLLAQRLDLARLHRHGGAHVGEHGVEVALALAQERVEEARGAGVVAAALACGPRAGRGARRTRARAPRRCGRRSRRAPGACTGRATADRSPSRRRAARTPPSGCRARARARAPPPGRAVLGLAEREHDVLGSRASSATSSASALALAEQRERGQRPLADDHRVHELDRDVARVRGAGGRAGAGQQTAAARAALGDGVAQLGDAAGLALEQPRAGLAAGGQARARAAPRPAR